MWAGYDEWVQSCGAPPLADLEFVHEGDLNLYLYPAVADYTDRRPLGRTWHRLDSSVRATDAPFEVPASIARSADPESKLVYLSLGSLGSADVGLMQRLVAVLAHTKHRFIVSKGPLADEYELPANMWGEAQVPQTNVLPHVDLVITHGGNNTTTEAFHFGKPMIVLPLFWDQYDNAQRMDELDFGVRLATYAFTDEQMDAALAHVLSPEVRAAAEARGAAIRARDGLVRGADVIEQVGRAYAGSREN